MTTSTTFTLRTARLEDVDAMTQVIQASVRALSRGFYTEAQAESGIRYVFGVDTTLVHDGTYFCVEAEGELVGCGGWSMRRTHYGGDHAKSGDDPIIDPATEPARIRAFFVAPAWARRGIGRMLLDACVDAARSAGFTRLVLTATLPGEPLYAAYGFAALERKDVVLPDGVVMTCVRMERAI